MFTVQTLIAIAVTVGVAAAWAVALTITGAIFQRDGAHTAGALHGATLSAGHASQTDDAQELVLR